MRKRYRVLLLAAIVAAVIVPVGFALSLEPAKSRPVTPLPSPVAAATQVMAPLLLDINHRTSVLQPSLSLKTEFPDSARLFLLGTVLIGLAIAVRRAS